MIEFIKNYMNTPDYLITKGQSGIMALIILGFLGLISGIFVLIVYIINKR